METFTPVAFETQQLWSDWDVRFRKPNKEIGTASQLIHQQARNFVSAIATAAGTNKYVQKVLKDKIPPPGVPKSWTTLKVRSNDKKTIESSTQFQSAPPGMLFFKDSQQGKKDKDEPASGHFAYKSKTGELGDSVLDNMQPWGAGWCQTFALVRWLQENGQERQYVLRRLADGVKPLVNDPDNEEATRKMWESINEADYAPYYLNNRTLFKFHWDQAMAADPSNVLSVQPYLKDAFDNTKPDGGTLESTFGPFLLAAKSHTDYKAVMKRFAPVITAADLSQLNPPASGAVAGRPESSDPWIEIMDTWTENEDVRDNINLYNELYGKAPGAGVKRGGKPLYSGIEKMEKRDL